MTLHVLSNPIKPICLGYFSEILFVEEYIIPSRLKGKKIIFNPPFLFLAAVAMLVGCLDCRTQF
jgi:hypothetical protein